VNVIHLVFINQIFWLILMIASVTSKLCLTQFTTFAIHTVEFKIIHTN